MPNAGISISSTTSTPGVIYINPNSYPVPIWISNRTGSAGNLKVNIAGASVNPIAPGLMTTENAGIPPSGVPFPFFVPGGNVVTVVAESGTATFDWSVISPGKV